MLPGLSKIGYNMEEPWVHDAIQWLLARQNDDGGFGETTMSYNDPYRLNGRGKSTPTQTAWGLMALLEVRQTPVVTAAVERVVNYLLE